MEKRWNIAVVCVTVFLYCGAILCGLETESLSSFTSNSTKRLKAWTPPTSSSIPKGPLGDSIRLGALLFDETPLYASHSTHAKLSCADCHADGGMQPFAAPMVGLPILFPMYNARAGHVISLKDRIQECFVRSENGTPLTYDGPEMKALVDYINWISQPRPNAMPFAGRGLIELPDLKPDPVHGREIYAAQCAGCHGQSGEGRRPLFPAVWGPNSFNDGAGMNGIPKMAAFIQHNMPQNRMGILSPQDSYDVAAFIHSQPRPAFNQAYKHY